MRRWIKNKKVKGEKLPKYKKEYYKYKYEQMMRNK